MGDLKIKTTWRKKIQKTYSIGSYIVDFCCPSEKLIIELDGDPHGEYHKIQEDENRDKYLESLGFTVLRFENRFVFQEPEYLKNEIREVFNKQKNRSDKSINHPGPYKSGPPLLQKEGKVLLTNWISTLECFCLYWSSR